MSKPKDTAPEMRSWDQAVPGHYSVWPFDLHSPLVHTGLLSSLQQRLPCYPQEASLKQSQTHLALPRTSGKKREPHLGSRPEPKAEELLHYLRLRSPYKRKGTEGVVAMEADGATRVPGDSQLDRGRK